MYKNRYEAAELLAAKLIKYKGENGVVLAVPRGGVPVGYVIAKALEMPLDITLSKKIGHPYSPEFAIGSVSLGGTVINDYIPGVSMDYIKKETERLIKSMKEKYARYMGDRKPVDIRGKIIIIADDGIATGNTILATVNAIRKGGPQKIIIAAPVASPSSVVKLSHVADDIVCLQVPEDFEGVGGYYEDFSQVSDAEVVRLLRSSAKIKDIT